MVRKMGSCLLVLALLCGCVACTTDAPPDSRPAESSDITATDTESTVTTTTTTSTKKTTKTTTTTTKAPAVKTVQRWVAAEIDLTSDREYDTPVYTVELDVTFTHKKTGKALTLPAFWDGGKRWTVRFALTETGDWSWKTTCSDTAITGLHGNTGQVTCAPYTGDLAIYKHGFLKAESGKPYFMYADGTPFFYLGDTHWTLPMEELDGTGGLTEGIAEAKGITSQFRHIMDYRAAQGYTVIQSQQLATWNGGSGNSWIGENNATLYESGVNDHVLGQFQTLDRYFAYIAEKGLVHAHSQFTYPTELIRAWFDVNFYDFTEEQLEALCRYWVARYCAYPVMWTTTQEGDNDYYGENICTPEDNPWTLVLEYIAKYDPYDHPSTCHQEHSGATRVYDSAFKDLPAHSWYAAQWSLSAADGTTPDWRMLREYWGNPGQKPVVNYEGHYDQYWTGTFGSRVQSWGTYLNGQVGFGYGVQPIWSLFWSVNDQKPPSGNGTESWDPKQVWIEGLYSPAGQQLTYIKAFLEQVEWWRLEPCFDGNEYYIPGGTNYSVATIENDVYLGYFYGKSAGEPVLGTLTGMKCGEYIIRWMNGQTGEYTQAETITVTDGIWKIPGKPDAGDWALSVRYEQ